MKMKSEKFQYKLTVAHQHMQPTFLTHMMNCKDKIQHLETWTKVSGRALYSSIGAFNWLKIGDEIPCFHANTKANI